MKGRYFASYHLDFYTGEQLSDDPDDNEGEEHHASELSNSGVAETETIQKNNPRDTLLDELNSTSTNQDTFLQAMPGVEIEAPRPPEPLLAAAYGDVANFVKLVMENKEALTVKDRNGWEPIHEAARWGQLQILEILIDSGVNINQVSNFDRGDSPLKIAMGYLKEDHPVLAFLKLHGGV